MAKKKKIVPKFLYNCGSLIQVFEKIQGAGGEVCMQVTFILDGALELTTVHHQASAL